MATVQAQGTTFTFNNGTIATNVVGIKSYTGFDGEAADIDITTLASTAKEYSIGLEDFGNFSLELIVDPDDTGQLAILAAKSAGATRECVLTLPTGTLSTATFNVVVKSFSQSGGVDEVIMGTVNMRITGAVVWS